MPKMLHRSLNISSIFQWNISPTGTTVDGTLVNLYLPNWQVDVAKYDDSVSSVRSW